MKVTRITSVLAVIALLVAPASGQGGRYVDARVQQGDVLDANPGVGSGGRNSGINPGVTGQAINSQLYVSGRTSGLSSFRGSRPYAPVGALQLSLPGASVRRFQQQSIGLQEATGGYAHRSSPYLDRAQTVLGLRGITSGLASPGSNVPLYSALSPQMVRELYSTSVRRYEPLLAEPAGRLLWQSPVQGPLAVPFTAGAGAAVPGRFDDAARAGAGAIFGLAWQDDREQLLAELNAVRRDRGAEAQRNPNDDRLDDDRRVGTMVTGRPGMDDEPTDTSAAPRRSLMPEPGQDAFHDLMMAILAKEAAEIASEGDDRRGDQDGAPQALVDPQESGTLVVRSLAGRNMDVFNGFMTEAQTLMRAGRYYDAAVKFSSAGTANPRNPFSQMGAALAMFAAGEPTSAAMRLRRSMEIFPPIMETRMAVGGMMDRVRFDRQLTDLDGLLGEPSANDNQMLLLLAAYMHASAGQSQQAKVFAQRLADVAVDPLLAAYAEFVLTGQRPDERAIRPAD